MHALLGDDFKEYRITSILDDGEEDGITSILDDVKEYGIISLRIHREGRSSETRDDELGRITRPTPGILSFYFVTTAYMHNYMFSNTAIVVPFTGLVHAETLVQMLCGTCITLLLCVLTWVVSMLF